LPGSSFFAPRVAKQVRTDIRHVEADFIRISESLCTTKQLYRPIAGRPQFIGLRCCGPLSVLMRDMLRIVYPTTYTMQNTKIKGVQWRDLDGDWCSHVWLNIKGNAVDPTYRQFLLRDFVANPKFIDHTEKIYIGDGGYIKNLLDAESDADLHAIKPNLARDIDRVDFKKLLNSGTDCAPAHIRATVAALSELSLPNKPLTPR
jgi:hypothetical protein